MAGAYRLVQTGSRGLFDWEKPSFSPFQRTDMQDTDSLSLWRWVLREGAWLGALLLATFLFLILFSYSPTDPGINQSGGEHPIHNYGGRSGAWVASVMLYLIGAWALLIPFFLLGLAWRAFRQARDLDESADTLTRGLLGGTMVLVAGAALTALYLDPRTFIVPLPHSGGGVLGYALAQTLVSGIDRLATTLLLLLVGALGVALLLGRSWLDIFEWTGARAWVLWAHLKGRASGRRGGLTTLKERLVRLFRKDADPAEGHAALAATSQSASSPGKRTVPQKAAPPTSSQKTEARTTPHSCASVSTQAQVNSVYTGGEGGLPPVDLLDPPQRDQDSFGESELAEMSALLEKNLLDFGVKAQVESVQAGPVVTRFEILPAPGVKVSQISNLAKDLARALSVRSVRVVEVIPGKSTVGIEIPNPTREVIALREIIASDLFAHARSPLTLALGKDIAGEPVVADLAKMPHLLVAGTTGSGKSVGINSMILSMLYKATPEQVRLIMVDPKMLELSVYEDIPHLLTPVVTDMNEASQVLRWCVHEMDLRYQRMAKLGVRNIAGFNEKVQAAIDRGEALVDPLWKPDPNFGHELSEEAPTLQPLPYIVVVIDEFADLIMQNKKVEELIARLAQKARAAGIHLILATQRPSVNVITGLIKANIPTRISFQVSSKVDSRTILDQMGAEQLLGQGDMLYLPPGSGVPRRVHGAFVSDDEVHRVVDYVKQQGAPQYLDMILQEGNEGGSASALEGMGGDAEKDSLYDAAVAFVIEKQRVSVSLIQRQFSIGYNRAARIVEAMERAGVVSPMESNGSRKVLVPKES
ncbi:DNA translocase FtsK [Candidatus Parcubacteria bacterium]|nr:MAG: DNA translocase FtsK [Candidatus Parcubacteria bacterium]